MFRAGLVAAVALALATSAGCDVDGADEAPELPPKRFDAEVPQGFFGINGQGLRPLAEDGKLEELDRHLDQIAAGGIDFIRAHVDWTRVEPNPPTEAGHEYDFAGLDAWMTALAEHGLAWQLLVVGVPTPDWASDPEARAVCGYRAAPARVDDVVSLVGVLAQRYGREGSFWGENPGIPYRPVVEYEIWNEPNFGSFWCPSPDPTTYAELLDESADRLHALDPRAEVLFGGLAGWKDTVPATSTATAHMSVPDFLGEVLAARPQLRRKTDAVAIHAYEPDPTAVLADVEYYRNALRSVGLGDLPMSLNETGWFTHGSNRGFSAIPDEQRAVYLSLLTNFVARTNCGLESFAPHTWITAENNFAKVEDWYGIADPDDGEPNSTGSDYISQVLLLEGRGSEAPPPDTAQVCRG